jgi:hypothetical protein
LGEGRIGLRASYEGDAVWEWLILATNVAVDAIDWLVPFLVTVCALEAFLGVRAM